MTALALAPRVPRIITAPEIEWDPPKPPTYDAASRRAAVFAPLPRLRLEPVDHDRRAAIVHRFTRLLFSFG